MHITEIFEFKCNNKECGQEFNQENIQLAICLYGVFFLAGPDNGFVGFTCPKCFSTNIIKLPYHAILQVKNHLASWIEIYKDSVNDITSVQQMASIRTDFEISQKQTEVDLLNEQKRNQKIIVIAVIIAFFLIGLLALGLFRRNKYIQKT